MKIALALAALLLCGHGTSLSPLSRTPRTQESNQVLFSEEEVEIDPSNTLAEKHKNPKLLRSEGRSTSGPNSKSSHEATLGHGVQINGYKSGAQNHESFVIPLTTRRLNTSPTANPPPTSYPTPLVPEAVGCFEQTSVYGEVNKKLRKTIVDGNPVQTCRSYCLGPLNKEDIQYMSFTCPRFGEVVCNCLTEGDLSGKSVASSALRRPDYECRGECRTFGAGGTICYDRSTDGSRVSEGCHGFLLNGEYLSEFEGYILGDGYRSMVYPIHQALFTPRSNVPTSSPTVSESPSTSVSPTVDAFTIFDWDEVEAMGEPYDASVPSDRDTRPVISVDGRFFAVASEFENDWAGAVYVYEWSDSGGRTLRDSLQGGDAGSRFGSSMAISDNGSVLAVGSCAHESNTGKVQIYQWNGSSYVQIGLTLVGDETGDYFGWGMGGSGLALSSDGTIIACGSWTGDYGGVYRAGYVKVYQYSDGNMSWTSLGSVLGVAEVPVLVHGSDHYNGAYYAGFGSAVDLSSDGLTLAVGSVEWSKNRGAVTVFTYDQTTSSDWTVRQVLLGAHKPGPIERWHAQPDQMGGRVSLSSDGNVLAVGAQNAVDPDSLHHHYNHGYVKVFLWDAAAGQYSQRGRTILGAHRENFGRVLSLSSDGTVVVTRSWTSHRLYAFKFTGRDFVSYGNYIYKSTNFGFLPSISGDGTRLVVPNRDARKVEVYEVPPPPTPFPTITPVTSMVAVEDHPKYGQPQFIHPATECSDFVECIQGIDKVTGDSCSAACGGQCCTGHEACKSFTGFVCRDGKSCMGSYSCKDATIGEVINSCRQSSTCQEATIHKVVDSCNTYYGCYRMQAGRVVNSCKNVGEESQNGHVGQKATCQEVGYQGSVGDIIDSCYARSGCQGTGKNNGSIGYIVSGCTSKYACMMVATNGGHLDGINGACNDIEHVCTSTASQAGSSMSVIEAGCCERGSDNINYGCNNKQLDDDINCTPSEAPTISPTKSPSTSPTSYILEEFPWSQITDFSFEQTSSQPAGVRVIVSEDGSVVAFGVPDSNSDSGQVHVYDMSTGSKVLRAALDGESAGDKFGSSMSMTPDGSTLVIGSEMSNRVYVYDWEASANNYVLRGTLLGSDGTSFGFSVELTNDGNFLAVGALYSRPYDNQDIISGSAKVFNYVGNQWEQVGSELMPYEDSTAVANDARFGWSLGLSSDGRTIAVGGIGANDGQGLVKLFNFDVNTGSWEEKQSFNGSTGAGTTSQLGFDLELSSDGEMLILGSPNADNPSESSDNDHGSVAVYKLNDSSGLYVQVGDTLYGTAAKHFGTSLAISSDTSMIVVGSSSDGGGAQVYKFNNVDYVQYGNEISGGSFFGKFVGVSGDGLEVFVWADASSEYFVYELPPPPTASPTASPTNSPSQNPTHSPSSSPTVAPRMAKYVQIQLTSHGVLQVKQVQIFDESSMNVATTESAVVTMSSTDGGNIPANAVDGDSNTAARTIDESMPWLRIELAQVIDIWKVIIDSDSDLSTATVTLLDEDGEATFGIDGSGSGGRPISDVLAAERNDSGALEINSLDFQGWQSSSPSTSPTMSPTSKPTLDAFIPVNIAGYIQYNDEGMCCVENMPEFIAATEAVLTETACEDDSSQICIARVISVCGEPVENIVVCGEPVENTNAVARKLQSLNWAEYDYVITLERVCGTLNCADAQTVADQAFAAIQQDITAAIDDGSFVAQLQTHTQGSSESLATMLSNAAVMVSMDEVVVVPGCFNPYVEGKRYMPGQYVSFATAELVGGTSQDNPRTVQVSRNYKCMDGEFSKFCGSAGFGPGSLYSDLVWSKEFECTGVANYDLSSYPLWVGIGCPPEYKTGSPYNAEDQVSYDSVVYQCAKEPLNQFCGMSMYEPGKGLYYEEAWEILGSCAGTVVPSSSPVHDALTDMGGCPGEWHEAENRQVSYVEGDVVSKNGLVFACREFPHSDHCSQRGYEPLEDNAWKDAWMVAGYCSDNIGPTQSPSFVSLASTGACPDPYKQKLYEEGDTVSVVVSAEPLRQVVYRCKEWPYSGFCAQFSPDEIGGDQGWMLTGSCNGLMEPTASPSFDLLAYMGGCPKEISYENPAYVAGDTVSITVSEIPERKVVYECKQYPFTAYCNQESFAPLGKFGDMAWKLKGACDGTFAPSSTPMCTYERCRSESISCACGTPNCPTGDGQTSGCTKSDDICNEVDVLPFDGSSLANYQEGDVVRIGTQRFKCRDWPNGLWCKNPMYTPLSTDDNIWQEAWAQDGLCV